MKRLSKFNTLDMEDLGLDTTDALSLIQQKDDRLKPQDAILYNNSYCSFGGIYKETNSTAKNNTLFAVEFYAYFIYNEELDNDMAYVGVIATNIEYLNDNNEIDLPKLGQGQYVEIYNSNKKPNELINELKNNVSVHGLSLEYVSGTFDEAAQKLDICA